MQEAQVWSLVGELRSHMPHGKQTKKQKKITVHCPFASPPEDILNQGSYSYK